MHATAPCPSFRIKAIITYFQREIEVVPLKLLSWSTKKKIESNETDNHVFAHNLTGFAALKASGF